MKCHRCGDAMVPRKFYDYGGYSWSWKCTRCGETMDQIVPLNQREIARCDHLPRPVDHSMEINLHKEVVRVMDKSFSSLNFQTKAKAEDGHGKCGMVFCSNCNGSGRYFYADKGVTGCNFCGGFGLIEIDGNFVNEDDREAISSCS